MTLEDFQKFCEKQAQIALEKQEKMKAIRDEAFEQKIKKRRTKGLSSDFIDYERGCWIVVKNNEVVDICDTKGEAWRKLYS